MPLKCPHSSRPSWYSVYSEILLNRARDSALIESLKLKISHHLAYSFHWTCHTFTYAVDLGILLFGKFIP
jgi:hypothetical protein